MYFSIDTIVNAGVAVGHLEFSHLCPMVEVLPEGRD